MLEPPPSEVLIDRPALRTRLDGALEGPLTLLVAPAGAGKSVLLDQWRARHDEVVTLRIDIDADDDDPVRLSRRLLAAVTGVRPAAAGLERLTALGAEGIGEPLLEGLAAELRSFPETVIVLDDLHHLANPRLFADLGRLVTLLPSNVHVVLSTRVDPPIAWSSLRLRNRMLEIRQGELALDRSEAAELVQRVARRELPGPALDAVIDRAEGWAAGLQLAGLAFRFAGGPEASDSLVAGIAGSDRLIADYLTEEVLEAVPEVDRDLLLRLSLLDTMTAELVDHVLERTGGQRLLERLEDESLFVVALDPDRARFRFHHLFREFLRYRSRSEDPEAQRTLLVRAAEFHLGRDEVAPAVEYLLRARDWGRALDAIMTRGSEVFETGGMRTVVRWITTVPEPEWAGRLEVVLELGILVGMLGESGRAGGLLGRVAADPRATVGHRIAAEAWRSALAQWNPRPEEGIRAADRALALIAAHPDAPYPDVMRLTSPVLMTTLAIGSRARAQFIAGDEDAAGSSFARALESDGIAYPPFRVGALGSSALLHIWQGRAGAAELLASEAIDTAATAELLAHPVIADAYLARALTAAERGMPGAAAAHLRDAMLRAEANHRSQLIWAGRYVGGLVAASEGRDDDALDQVDLARGGDLSAPGPAILDRLRGLRLGVLRRTGRAEQALRRHGGTGPLGPSVAFETAAAALDLRDRAAARRLVGEMPTPAHDSPLGDIRRSLLLGWIAELDGSHEHAIAHVEDALDRAEPEDLVAVFLECGPVVLDLVGERSIDRGGVAARVATLRSDGRHVIAPSDGTPASDPNAGLPDPLTSRELEILAFLPDHSTNAELASRCFVSVNTVKTHTAHIYRKLGVSGRSAAIARARELGLLDSVSRPDRVRA
ncbi:LuxR C-terminal-related transcriptional regulator [Agromyces binzhouensis]|uniref:LuxR C-terminal-related transcriptional regulator n=1 Tax=Agromyces binzhouensis TaxID=1817495 RepID=UPI00362750D1